MVILWWLEGGVGVNLSNEAELAKFVWCEWEEIWFVGGDEKLVGQGPLVSGVGEWEWSSRLEDV